MSYKAMNLFFVLIAFGFLQLTTGQLITQTFDFTNSTELTAADFSECGSIGLKLIPLDGSTFDVVPPFYMFSFAWGGVGMVDYIGSDSNNLTWTIRQPQGSTLLFYVVDGGGARSAFDEGPVQSGSSNCHSTEITSDIKVNAESSQVQTCSDLSLSITGGTKPYTLSVVSANFTNNFTLGAKDDGFNYIDQVETGTNFIVAASDATGQWAIGTNIISSVGSSDLTCPGKTSAGTSSVSKSSSNTGAVIGGVVGGLVFLALAIGLAVFFYRRRREETRLSETNRKHAMPFDSDDVSPYVLPPGEGGGDMRNAFVASGSASYQRASSGYPPPPSSSAGTRSDTSDVPLLRSPLPQHRPTLASTAGGSAYVSHTGSIYHAGPNPGSGSDAHSTSNSNANFNDPYLRSTSPEGGSSGSHPNSNPNTNTNTNAAPLSSKQLLMAREEERRRQTVVQHQDAEDILDVPPIYRERGASGV